MEKTCNMILFPKQKCRNVLNATFGETIPHEIKRFQGRLPRHMDCVDRTRLIGPPRGFHSLSKELRIEHRQSEHPPPSECFCIRSNRVFMVSLQLTYGRRQNSRCVCSMTMGLYHDYLCSSNVKSNGLTREKHENIDGESRKNVKVENSSFKKCF